MVVDKALWIEGVIKRFIDESPENTLRNEENDKAWANPLVGFSSGSDPLYEFYKADIGDFFLSPLDIFNRSFPEIQVAPNEITVISWILPQTEMTKTEQRKRIEFTGERWTRARLYGEEVNDKLRKHVVTTIMEAGFKAVAPLLSPLFKSEKSQRYGYASTWSERHAAYAAGLGTFGLCDGLITPVGKAMRCGSVIANIEIPPSKRNYTNHREYCLFYSNGTCGKCIQRCPVGAISETGHDKVKCRSFLDVTREYVKTAFNLNGYGCGLCQTRVPCESGIPNKHIRSKTHPKII